MTYYETWQLENKGNILEGKVTMEYESGNRESEEFAKWSEDQNNIQQTQFEKNF